MFNFKKRSYDFLLLTAIALILLLFFDNKKIKEIDLDDTSSMIPITFILWTIPICLILFWTLYSTTKKLLYSTVLTRIHTIITILSVIFIIAVFYWGSNPFEPIGRRYFDSYQYEETGRRIQLVMDILLIGQFVYVVNIAWGLFKYSKSINKVNQV
jgi:hypothetical protein